MKRWKKVKKEDLKKTRERKKGKSEEVQRLRGKLKDGDDEDQQEHPVLSLNVSQSWSAGVRLVSLTDRQFVFSPTAEQQAGV